MLALIVLLLSIPAYVLFAVYAERKVSAFIQDRVGPMVVGYYGLGQTVADILKLLQKEDIRPASADKKLFLLAPIVIYTSIFAGYATLPLTPDVIGSSAKIGLFYLLAIIALDIVGIWMAGWGSNNKFSLLGAIRAIAQIISYEVPLGLTVLAVVLICNTLDLQEICYQQGVWISHFPGMEQERNYLFGIKALGVDVTDTGGILTWNVFRSPILFFAFIVFFICSLAEANRAPFDIPEAESELVAGFHTEYSGFRWALLFLGEYAMMLLVCFLMAILFFGGWNTPLPNIGQARLAEWTSGPAGTIGGNLWGAFWLVSKAFTLIFMQMMVRWTYPRLRVDQLMYLCWKVLTPFALLLVLGAAAWKMMMF